MFDYSLTNQSLVLPFGISESVEVCKDFLSRRAFVVVQCGAKQLIGLRQEDSTRVIVKLELVADYRTDVSISPA